MILNDFILGFMVYDFLMIQDFPLVVEFGEKEVVRKSVLQIFRKLGKEEPYLFLSFLFCFLFEGASNFEHRWHIISNWKVMTFWGVATRSSYPPPSLWHLTLKWSNFFPFGRISGLEKYVMFQHQVCPFSRNVFDFVCFSRFWLKNGNFLAIF